jgi:tRNA threonylcarbamoyladenosine modification (KEOPS) complex Cgi121 subunit
LLERIEEFGRYLLITGFREVKIVNVEAFFEAIRNEKPADAEIQFFDAQLVATWQHLYFAVLNALTAFKNGENISRNLAMEAMLYVSAQGQIRKAVKLLGIKPSSSNIAMTVVADRPNNAGAVLSMTCKNLRLKPDETVIELTRSKEETIRKAFDISEAELEAVRKGNDLEAALVDLVIERMALLSTQR